MSDAHRPSVVLANPPFGRKRWTTMVGADGREAREATEVARPDFWVTTSTLAEFAAVADALEKAAAERGTS